MRRSICLSMRGTSSTAFIVIRSRLPVSAAEWTFLVIGDLKLKLQRKAIQLRQRDSFVVFLATFHGSQLHHSFQTQLPEITIGIIGRMLSMERRFCTLGRFCGS
mmetsp:Transcript_24082/g.56583  ORF Transcript_24082/g.56583 Transcript_24082/m.56583 type:complete len:104 (-) Transcript_24082:997-1308(-)